MYVPNTTLCPVKTENTEERVMVDCRVANPFDTIYNPNKPSLSPAPPLMKTALRI